MKPHVASAVFACLAAFSLLFAGCGGGGSTKVDTKEFEQAFANAEGSLKGPAMEAAKALKADKLIEGTTALANLAKSAERMTNEQREAMQNLGINIQIVLSNAGDKISDPMKVWQGVEDMIAALQGRESATVGSDPDRVRPRVVTEEE